MFIKKLSKLKKYLFLISILFLFLSSIHLLYTYLYEDAKTVPVEWGAISEWLIWVFPSLNPLVPLSWNNEYVVSLLYRSLLKYDVEQQKVVWDIANCDIESISSVECYINENAYWSNWERITSDDIVATFEKIKNTESNLVISSLLEDIEIQKNGDIIIFNNSKNDINALNIFFQPIVKKEILDNISDEEVSSSFNKTDWIYSGDFVVSNISSDSTIWISKIILDRNPYFDNWNISKLTLNIFPDTQTFLKNRQSVNIFNDNENIIGNSAPRLANHKYTVPQFVWLFINKENISSYNLRTFILNEINSQNLTSLLWEENFKKINNPYMQWDDISSTPNNRNFEEIMDSLWYKQKSSYINNISQKQNNTVSGEVQIQESDLEELSIDDYQEDSNVITSPNYVEKYNFVTKDNILLKWDVSSWVDGVYVNDYKLQWFNAWDSVFNYRLLESYDSISKWENQYNIYYETNWEKELVDQVVFYYSEDQQELEEYKNGLVEELYTKEITQQREEQENNRSTQEEENLNKEELEKYNNLDDKLYYNESLEPFTLSLYYLNSQKDLEQTAKFIQDSLKSLWIKLDLIPYSIKDIWSIINDKKQYDLILTWINLWYFDFNIFPYFHSSQADDWYNFANLKRTSLDLLLEELKSNIYWEDKINEIQENILEILKEEQVIKTLYTPKINLLIDKNIKNTKFIDSIPNKSLRSYIINQAYIREERNINLENKNILGFFKFLFNKLYE